MEATKYLEVPCNEKKLHPLEKANPLSKLFFCWLVPIFYKGHRAGLGEDDVCVPLKEHDSSTLGRNVLELWEKEVKTKVDPSLAKVLWQVFGSELIITGIFLLFTEFFLRLTQPMALSKVLEFYEPGSLVSINEAYMYAGVMIVTVIVDVICRHYLTLATLHLGLKIRVACCALIYRKSLKLSKSAVHFTTVGQMVNLLSNDVGKFDVVIQYLHFLWVTPIAIVVSSYLLYIYVGITGIVGVGFLLLFIPLQIYLGKKTSTVRRNVAICTDERIRLMNEIISGIKSIKMYTWEEPFAKLVDMSRRKEIKQVRKKLIIRAIENTLTLSQTRTCIYLCLLTYVLLGHSPTSQYVFVLTSFYNILRNTVVMYFNRGISNFAEGKISISRIKKFLLYDEVQKDYVPPQENANKNSMVTLESVSIKWSDDPKSFSLQDINFCAKFNQFVVIIGPVGSGKTTLLNTILRELEPETGTVKVTGNISYASQEPWIFASTVEQNIIFGQEYIPSKFEKVLQACDLNKDLKEFPFGKNTVVGERGVMLSGGQKMRVNLARAVYRDADIYIFDDPLSAVDAEVGKHIFENCFKKYLKNKCVILVTHQHQFIHEADKIYVLQDGKIEASGTYEELQSNHQQEFTKIFREQNNNNKDIPEEESRKSKEENLGNPVQNKEGRMSGRVSWEVYKYYMNSGGGWCSIAVVLLAFVISQFIGSFVDWFGAFWTNMNQHINSKRHLDDLVNVNSTHNDTSFLELYFNNTNSIIFYSVLISTFLLITLWRSLFFYYFCSKASIVLHSSMFKAIVNTSLNFFNMNSTGRILNRFSKDMGGIDEQLPLVITDTIQIGLIAFTSFILIIIVNRFLALPTILLVGVFFILRKIFLNSSRDMKRLQGTTRSPMYAHLTASIEGLTTIRALNAEEVVTKEFDDHQNHHSSASFMYISACRAFGLWLDVNCVLYVSLVTLSALLIENERFGGNIGLAITQSLGLTSIIQWGIRQWSEAENQMTGVERIKEYADLTPESIGTTDEHLGNWPRTNGIRFENVCLRYSESEPIVLKNISFDIGENEKVGIVGRTGAGKSSLITALFRLAPLTGRIVIDKTDTSQIPLKVLRSSITIIPQDPVLFSGTLRRNLDPFEEHSDEVLWNALEDVELKPFVRNLSDGLYTLMLEGGANFSVGQRQLVCLARAVVRNNKIVVLDEATANIDPHTDRLIRNTIRKNFADSTVLTIAHRLQTIIDCDKVLVMDAGSAVEFDSPHKLLEKENGVFKALVAQTGSNVAEELKRLARENFETLREGKTNSINE